MGRLTADEEFSMTVGIPTRQRQVRRSKSAKKGKRKTWRRRYFDLLLSYNALWRDHNYLQRLISIKKSLTK